MGTFTAGFETLDKLLRAFRIVEPILVDQRLNLGLDDRSSPCFVSILVQFVGTEKAVSHAKPLPWRGVLLDLLVQVTQPFHNYLRRLPGSSGRQPRCELLGIEHRPEWDKCKPSPKRIVNHRKRAVRSIHETDQVHVRGHVKTVAGICEVQSVVAFALVRFDQEKPLAEILLRLPRLISSMTRTYRFWVSSWAFLQNLRNTPGLNSNFPSLVGRKPSMKSS
jgi:hypothetical protein